MVSASDTIFAPATPQGRAAVAVIRVSGPRADAVLAQLVTTVPPPRVASVRIVHDPRSGETLDQCLVLRFEAGRSFTGEAAFELQCHGGVAVVAALLRALGSLPGMRLAEPGEFTRRAFEAGRLDLTEAEALADLAIAETEAQRRQALRGLQGELSHAVSNWRAQLIRARALLEASIDFADEEMPDISGDVSASLAALSESLTEALRGAAAAERVRNGYEVALVGAPNAGKSSLINALARRDVALTSAVPGTTRDVIEVRLDLNGLAVTLLDTAGLRETEDPVEQMGVWRAQERAAAADLRVVVRGPGDADLRCITLQDDDIIVASKADLGLGLDGWPVSAVTGAGLENLMSELAARLSRRSASAGVVLRHRQAKALEEGLAHIDTARSLCARDASVEIAAEELRLATTALDTVVGRVDSERILDEIFSTFCLGK